MTSSFCWGLSHAIIGEQVSSESSHRHRQPHFRQVSSRLDPRSQLQIE